jgi:large subunit ribosomal protein L13
MKTTQVHAAEERWLLFDASEHVLGRLAVRIARALMGKDRPEYTPSELSNTHVVVVNGAQPRLTGAKAQTKSYAHYTLYAGGYKVVGIDRMRERRPHDIVKLAVRRMLPKNRLGRRMLRNLKVYAGGEHPHTAQKPLRVEP